MDDFAATLVAARRRAGLTQAQVAQAAGLTPSYLSFLENRKKPPPSEEACRNLAEVLGLDPDELTASAQMERAPERLQERVSRLSSSLSRERSRRHRLLRAFLSPFLFAGPPGYVDSAVGSLGWSTKRKRRLRETLRALERRDFDQADDVAAILDTMPDDDRELLLESLPELLAARTPTTGHDESGPSKDTSLPVDGDEERPSGGRWFVAQHPFACDGIEWRAGDQLWIEPVATPEPGDVLMAREGGTMQFSRLGHSGDEAKPFRLTADSLLQGGARRTVTDNELAYWWERCGQGAVAEIRRRLRPRR